MEPKEKKTKKIRKIKAEKPVEFSFSSLSPKSGSKKKRKRVGRGTSSGHGKTCCRGHKGQKSRSGGVKRPGFEGGQTPLYRRLPKLTRFKNFLFKKEYAVLNLSDLSKFKDKIDYDSLVAGGYVKAGDKVKVLGDGDVSKPLTVFAHAFSESAKKKIAAAGGKAELIKQG